MESNEDMRVSDITSQFRQVKWMSCWNEPGSHFKQRTFSFSAKKQSQTLLDNIEIGINKFNFYTSGRLSALSTMLMTFVTSIKFRSQLLKFLSTAETISTFVDSSSSWKLDILVNWYQILFGGDSVNFG